MDLPVWQELRSELYPKGVEIVTVALDTGGAEAARSWIEAAKPEHPSLIDAAHVVDELFGVVNVPNAVWIDEDGVIVRPAEPAVVQRGVLRDMEIPDNLPPVLIETLREAKKIQADPEMYVAALRDWAERGADSPYALSPEEVVQRSGDRPRSVAQAAASFELGQHLYRAGRTDAAVRWFRDAHALQPDNWTYRRQAWQFADPFQGRTDLYEGSWLDDVKKIGAENYYPPLDM